MDDDDPIHDHFGSGIPGMYMYVDVSKLDIFLIARQENWIIQRVPIAKWLSGNIILWGVTLSLQAAMKNFEGLIALRAFLGVFEAVSQPAFTLLSSIWYTREEQGGCHILVCLSSLIV